MGARGRIALAGATALAVGASGSPAHAEVNPTAQAQDARAEFLAAAPRPPQVARICVVDSGVDLNPDTEGVVVSRQAVDGGSPADQLPSKHGTNMVSVIGAPANGWGTVGVWPQAEVLSVRALLPGELFFRPRKYGTGIQRCLDDPAVKVIQMAIGTSSTAGYAPEDVEFFEQAAATAQLNDVNIVVSAGNDAGGVQYPARLPGALAVGAVAGDRLFCDFSSRGPELGISAPGCFVNAAGPDGRPAVIAGTSPAAALASGVIVSLRSYRPDLSASAAEQLVVGTSGQTPAHAIDATAAFQAAGLGTLVHARAPVKAPTTGLSRPALRSVRRTKRAIKLRLVSLPDGATVQVSFGGRTIHTKRTRITIRARRWRPLALRFHHPELGYGPVLKVRRPRLTAAALDRPRG